jgi:hypothetical protein
MKAFQKRRTENCDVTAEVLGIDGEKLIVLRNEDLDNSTFGTLKDGLCQRMGKPPAAYALVSHKTGCRVDESQFMRPYCVRSSASSRQLHLIFILWPLDYPVRVHEHELEFDGQETVNMRDPPPGNLSWAQSDPAHEKPLTWAWNKPVVRDADHEVGRRAEIDLVPSYTQLPFDVFKNLCQFVPTPVMLLDFRLVCKAYRVHVDGNLSALLAPFAKDIDNLCTRKQATRLIESGKAPPIGVGTFAMDIGTASLIGAVQLACRLIPPPQTSQHKLRMLGLITGAGEFFKKNYHDTRVHHELIWHLVTARGESALCKGTPYETSAHNEKAVWDIRLEVACRAAFPRGGFNVLNRVTLKYAIVSNGMCLFETWFDDQDVFQYTELNLVRAHACLHALRHRLWEGRGQCTSCHSGPKPAETGFIPNWAHVIPREIAVAALWDVF